MTIINNSQPLFPPQKWWMGLKVPTFSSQLGISGDQGPNQETTKSHHIRTKDFPIT